MSANITAATAQPISALPFHVTGVDTRPNPPDLTDPEPDCGELLSPAWYSYTATASDVAIGVIANPNYFPMVAIYSGTPDVLTELDCTAGFQPSTLYVRTEPGTTYYIVVCDEDGEGGGDLEFQVLAAPCLDVPVGSIAVAAGGLIWFLSSDDGSLLQMQQLETETSGYASDVLDSGPWMVQKTTAGSFYESHQAVGTLIDAAILPLDDATYGPDIPFRHRYGTNTWYVPMPERDLAPTPDHYQSILHAMTSTGTVVDGPWTITDPPTATGGIELHCCAVNPAGTILYLSGGAVGVTRPEATVFRYDLVGDAWLSNLITLGPAPSMGDTFGYIVRDLLVMPNGHILVTAEWEGVNAPAQTAGIVNEYEADGTLVASYPVVDVSDDNINPKIHLASAVGTEDTQNGNVWVSFRPNAANDSTIRTFQLWVVGGGGTIAQTVEVSLDNEDGPFLIPAFGSFFITRVAIPACSGPEPEPLIYETIPIRMLRRSPTMSQDGKRLFFGKFQLDMQVGVGNTVDPGANPKVYLRTSNDGGQTFGNTREASMGAIGAYNTRVQWYQNGSARNRVFEIWTDAPTVVAFVQSWLEITEGES